MFSFRKCENHSDNTVMLISLKPCKQITQLRAYRMINYIFKISLKFQAIPEKLRKILREYFFRHTLYCHRASVSSPLPNRRSRSSSITRLFLLQTWSAGVFSFAGMKIWNDLLIGAFWSLRVNCLHNEMKLKQNSF